MSDSIRPLIDGFNAHDVERMVGLCHADVEITVQRSELEGSWLPHSGPTSRRSSAQSIDATSERSPALSHPGISFRSAVSVAGGTFEGIDGLRRWGAAVDGRWDACRIEALDAIAVSPVRAIVALRLRGVSRRSRVPRPAQNAIAHSGWACGWRASSMASQHIV